MKPLLFVSIILLTSCRSGNHNHAPSTKPVKVDSGSLVITETTKKENPTIISQHYSWYKQDSVFYMTTYKRNGETDHYYKSVDEITWIIDSVQEKAQKVGYFTIPEVTLKSLSDQAQAQAKEIHKLDSLLKKCASGGRTKTTQIGKVNGDIIIGDKNN